MKASEYIKLMQDQIKIYGDHPIIGGHIMDDDEPSEFIPLDEKGRATTLVHLVVGYFIE